MLGRPGCKISKVQPNAIYMDLSAFARIDIDVKVFCPNSSVTFHLIQSGQTPTVETIRRVSNVSDMHSDSPPWVKMSTMCFRR